MSFAGLLGSPVASHSSINLATSLGVVIPANAANGTLWGTPVEIFSSLPFTTALLRIVTVDCVYTPGLIDLMIGPSGSEVSLGLRLLGNESTTVFGGRLLTVPLAIPRGVRLSARARTYNSAPTQTMTFTFEAIPSSAVHPSGFAQGACIGYTGAFDDSGVFFPSSAYASATANTMGAFVELSAALPFRVRRIHVQHMHGTGASDDMRRVGHLAIGPAGSEVVFHRWSSFVKPASFGFSYNVPVSDWDIACDIPAGTRLAWALQSTLSSSTYLYGNFHIYG